MPEIQPAECAGGREAAIVTDIAGTARRVARAYSHRRDALRHHRTAGLRDASDES